MKIDKLDLLIMQFLKVLPQHQSINVPDPNNIDDGLGDRHQQVVDGVTTNYTLDLAAGLTQVLDDGTNTYLYGNGRIAQAGSTTEYFIGDALGSVRQLADSAGTVTLTQNYAPYGDVVSSVGTSQTSYAFTGEMGDASGLTYLRARYLDSNTGRFISRDTWNGDYNRPLSLNRWNYGYGNPINWVDPSGMIPEEKADEADELVEKLRKYNVYIEKDWGYHLISTPSTPVLQLPNNIQLGCQWDEGSWRTIRELRLVKQAVTNMATKLGGISGFKFAMGDSLVNIHRVNRELILGHGAYSINNVILPNNVFSIHDDWAKGQIVHELAHVWDTRQTPPFYLSYAMNLRTKYFVSYCDGFWENCPPASEPPPDDYAAQNEREDFAQSFAYCMYPNFSAGKLRPLGPIRRTYFESLMSGGKCAP